MTTIRSNISTVLNDTGSNEPHPLHPQKVHSAGEAGVHEASGSGTLQLPKSATRDLRSRSRLWGWKLLRNGWKRPWNHRSWVRYGNTFVLKPWWNSCETQDRRCAAFCDRLVRCWKIPAVRRHAWVHYKNKKWDHGALLGAALRGIHQQPLWLQPSRWHRCVTWIQWGYRLVELSNDIYIYNPHLYLYLYRCHNTMFRHIDHCLPAIGWGWFWRMSQDISWSWKMRAKKRWRAAWNRMWFDPSHITWNCGFLGISGVKFETPPYQHFGVPSWGIYF